MYCFVRFMLDSKWFGYGGILFSPFHKRANNNFVLNISLTEMALADNLIEYYSSSN